MGKQAVKVVIRTKPTPNFSSKNIAIDPITSTVTVHIPKDPSGGHINNQTETWKFKFDKIMHNASQEDVFAFCAKDIVQQVAEGMNGTVMCYGQTGAGKTFTMNGSTPNFKYRGVIPRAINQLFQETGSHSDQEFSIKVSFLEIYNEQIWDLLSDEVKDMTAGSGITIQDDAKGEVHVKGLTLQAVRNEEEALNCLFEGETRKTLAATRMNENSSRAHCVYTLHVERKSQAASAEKVIHSKLHLVDLAGNERTKKLDEAARMKEANYINKSLTFLEQVVVAACDHKKDHVPYRQSKLTNLLKNSIGGNCHTVVISNIWPEELYLEETISTLKFAQRMMKVQNEAVINEVQDPQLLLKKYKREANELRQELAMHDTLAAKGRIQYDAYTPEQQYEIQKVAEKFLKGQLEDIEQIQSMRQVKELLAQMKNCYNQLKHDGKAILEASDFLMGADGSATSEKGGLNRAKTMAKDGIGEVVQGGEFGLGIAPKDSRPIHKIELTKEKEAEIAEAQAFEDYSLDDRDGNADDDKTLLENSRTKQKKASLRALIPKQQAFLEFKKEETGLHLEESIVDNRNELKRIKLEVRDLTEKCNTAKRSLDAVKGELDKKREKNKSPDRGLKGGIEEDEILEEDEGPAEIIDEEELNLLYRMKDLKKQYKNAYNLLKSSKSEVNQIQAAIDIAKQRLVSEFETWYSETFDNE